MAERTYAPGFPRPCSFCKQIMHSPKAVKHHMCRSNGPVDEQKYRVQQRNPNAPTA